MDDNLIIVNCNVTINDEFKKVASENAVFDDETDIGEFEFVIESENDYTIFSIVVSFKNDDGECRAMYSIHDNDRSIVHLIAYNTLKNITSSYTMFCDMQKIYKMDDINFYAKPKIIIHPNGVKEVTIDLFTK